MQQPRNHWHGNPDLDVWQLLIFARAGLPILSASTKHRQRLYRLLEQAGIRWTTTIVGYTAGARSLMGWYVGARRRAPRDPGMWFYARLIHQKRLLAADVKPQCKPEYFPWSDHVASAWHQPSIDATLDVLLDAWPFIEDAKYHPLNNAVKRKPIKRIETDVAQRKETLLLLLPVSDLVDHIFSWLL